MTDNQQSPSSAPKPPFVVRLCITAVTALVTSGVMSFVGLAANYGFREDFAARWLKAFAIGYVALVPILLFTVPFVQQTIISAFANRYAKRVGP
jgi:Protein of unknown function (DUF2798)